MGKSIKIEIDVRSGFCHGVIRAIRKAEQELNTDKSLYCLGEIVHNSEEVSRLNRKGLQTIDILSPQPPGPIWSGDFLTAPCAL